jgi:multidrug resistance efflux pump
VNRALIACAMAAVALAACSGEEPVPEPGHSETDAPAGPTNRIDIPPAVIQNLGITFAKVERRHVDRTLRMPGAFEPTADARRDYRAPLGGRVNFTVTQYAMVNAGDEIATIASADWRNLQAELGAQDTAVVERKADLAMAKAERLASEADIAMYPRRIEAYKPRLEALETHHKNLETTRDLWKARLTELEELSAKGAGKAGETAEARARLAEAEQLLSGEEEVHADLHREIGTLALAEETARNNLPVLQAAENAATARVTAAEKALELALRGAASTLGLGYEELKDDAWRKIDNLSIRAARPGIVMDWHASQGELVEAGESLFHVIDHSRLQFRARALQADLGRLDDGLNARVVPPVGGSLEGAEPAKGKVTLSPMADADARLIEVIVTFDSVPRWARAGISAELEVVWDEADEPELAMPNRALIRDGLETLFFVRDPADPNKVIRTVAETGPSDGRWTVVYFGVMEGSEVVLDGTYELKLTGGGKSTVKGHFHADGTFHAEGTPEPGG